MQVVGVVEIGDFFLLCADEPDGNLLADFHSEEAAVVELRAVVADQAEFARWIPLRLRVKANSHWPRPSEGRLIAGLVCSLTPSISRSTNRCCGAAEAFSRWTTAFAGAPTIGRGNVEIHSFDGCIWLRASMAIDHDNGDLGLPLGPLPRVSRGDEPLVPTEFLHVRNHVNNPVGHVDGKQHFPGLANPRGQIGPLVARAALGENLADLLLGAVESAQFGEARSTG